MLEKTTGAKISIRGKGSIKEGQFNVAKQNGEEDDDPLHVLIVADTDEQLENASAEIEKLLIPVQDHLNPTKAIQLRKVKKSATPLLQRFLYSFMYYHTASRIQRYSPTRGQRWPRGKDPTVWRT